MASVVHHRAAGVAVGEQLLGAFQLGHPLAGPRDLADHLDALAMEGRLVSVGRLGGRSAEIDLNELARKRLTLRGVTFRTRTLDEYAAIAEGVRAVALPHVRSGLVRPSVTEVFPLAKALVAQDRLAADRQGGKIVLAAAP